MKYGEKQMSETFLVGALLAVVGGLLDAYTYLQRGGVFANAQTGNIVLFGMKIAEGKVWESIYYLIPILSFFLGIVVSEYMKETNQNRFKLHWRQITIVLEILVLLSIVFMHYQGNMIANTLVSFACSLQVQSFRKINGNAYATTMCTGNLRSAAESLYAYKKTKDKGKLVISLQYYGIITFFIIGASLGTILVKLFADDTILFACAILTLVFFILFQKEKSEDNISYR